MEPEPEPEPVRHSFLEFKRGIYKSRENSCEVGVSKYGLGIHSTGAQSSKIVQQLRQNRLGMSTVNLGFHSRTAHFHIAQKQSNL